MKVKTMYKTIVMVCILFVLMMGSSIANPTNDNLKNKVEQKKSITDAFPSLMQSIRFNEEIYYCNKKIPIDQQDILTRLEKEMLLALWDRPQVILWIKRSGKYFRHIEQILNKYNLPMDLKYVPIVESALRPHAGSIKGAVGFWQFLRSTGRQYGLRVDNKIDERKNIFKSTDAACRYLINLEKRFGSYFLALAAYNMGEYALKAEINAQKNNDFFSLYLPLETQRYVLKLICAKLIIENPSKYGFSIHKSDVYPTFTFDQVNFKTDFQIPIVLVAQAAGTSFKTIKDYNPELRGYFINKGKTSIVIPKGSAKGFKKQFSTQYQAWQKTYKKRIHIVKKGESLTAIAKKNKLPLSSLLKLNNYSVRKIIHPGERVRIE